MYAVILSGGKQYRVQEGDVLKLELMNAEVGETIEFNQVLLMSSPSLKTGQPFLSGCKVTATIVSHGRHKKIHIIKFRRRKHHEKWQGHRQYYTEVKINQIVG